MADQERRAERNTKRIGRDESMPFTRVAYEIFGTVHRIWAKPLYGLVTAIDISRHFAREHSGHFILRPLTRFLAVDEEAAKQSIQRTAEFKAVAEAVAIQGHKKPGRKEQAEKAQAAYLGFLSGDADPPSKTFASSPRFQEYVKTQAQKAELGPYFVDLLGILDEDDLIRERHEDLLDIFSELDGGYFWFQENLGRKMYGGTLELQGKEPRFVEGPVTVPQAFDNFTTANKILLDGLLDEENPAWREFALKFFPALYDLIKFTKHPFNYDKAVPNIERARMLASSVEPHGWFLMNYIALTSHQDFREGRVFDEQLLRGEVEQAMAYMEFAGRAFFNRSKAEDFMPYEKDWAWIFTLKHFANGELTPEELKAIPEAWDKLRQAYFSLTPDMREKIHGWSEGEAGVDEQGRTVVELSLWFNLLLSPILREQPELVARTVASGIPPAKNRIEQLRGKPEILAAMSEFSKSLHPLAQQGFDVVSIIEHWTDQLLSGQAQIQELPQVLANLHSIRMQEAVMYQERGITGRKREIVENQLARIYDSPEMLRVGNIKPLLAVGIYPSPRLVEFIKEHGPEGIEQLIRLQELTQRGQLDPTNLVQRDLEYLNYLDIAIAISPEWGQYSSFPPSFDEFSRLPFVAEGQRQLELSYKERMETEAAAFEAANLYWFINNRVQSRRKLAVIGNERYGAYFVIEPLRSHLEELGVPVSIYYVRSSGNSGKELKKVARAIRAYIDREGIDDLVIVDGTANSFSGDIPRLPTSLEYYRGIFTNRRTRIGGRTYKIAHWVPVPSDKITVGRGNAEPYIPASDKTPQIILANPVIVPKRFEGFPRELSEHSPGYLDDPNKFANQSSEVVLTNRGPQMLLAGRTEREFVDLIQGYMIKVLPRYIRESDPLNLS